MVDGLAAPYAFEKDVLFMVALRRDQRWLSAADDLFTR